MRDNLKYFLVIILIGIVAWYKTLNFWFFKGYEATWFTGLSPHTLVNLIKGHGFLYFIDYKVFGWNPAGWYATSILLHLIASILLFYLIFILTKNKILSFIASIIFVASTSYNDVLTWGSFNSYYPLLLSFMLLTLITYHKFKQKGKKIFLLLSLLFSFLGFFTRETGIVVVGLILGYELAFSENLKNKKIWIGILKRLTPFLIALIIFFLAHSVYGGTGGDSADGNVKLQMRFLKDKMYLEYAAATFSTLGKLIPPQFIPYTLLNLIREILSHIFNPTFIANYFFSFLGFLFFGVLGVITYLLRENEASSTLRSGHLLPTLRREQNPSEAPPYRAKGDKKYFKLAVFSLFWIFVFSLFVSLAVPSTNEALIRDYEWNSMRYRYFAFIGTSIMLSILFLLIKEKLIKKFSLKAAKTIFRLIIILFISINLVLIWNIESDIYAKVYRPQKEFYTTFKNYFPTLPKNAVFYIYPYASGLSDYLLEWHLIKEKTYPNLVGQPFRVESQIIAILDKIKSRKMNLSQVFFLDYDQKKGLLNRTKEVKSLILSQKEYPISLQRLNGNVFESEIFQGPNTEFPYDLEFILSSSFNDKFIGSTPDSNRFRALVDYNIERKNYLDNVSLQTAYTASQRDGEPFFHTLPQHLIDGNIGPRSFWISDTFKPWVQIDLGKEEEIKGVIWGSQLGTRAPATYSFYASSDGKTWNTIKSVKNFGKASAIDVFEKEVKARFIRMEIYTTLGGDFALLDEFEVLNSNSQNILLYYKDRDKLFYDANGMYKFVSGREDLDYAKSKGLAHYWGKLTWETNKTTAAVNNQNLYFPYNIEESGQEISIKIPEGEVFAGEGDFLKKHIISILLEFGEVPFNINIKSAVFAPRY